MLWRAPMLPLSAPTFAKKSGPLHIDGYSVALSVAIRNATTSCRRTEFDGPDVAIECLQIIFDYSIFTIPVNFAHRCKRIVVILQTPCLKLAHKLQTSGRLWFATERTSKGNLLAGALLLVLFVYGLFIFHAASQTNAIAATKRIDFSGV